MRSLRFASVVRERSFDELSEEELEELDRLAGVLAGEPKREELLAFSRWAVTPVLETAESDSYSFARP